MDNEWKMEIQKQLDNARRALETAQTMLWIRLGDCESTEMHTFLNLVQS